MLFYVSRTTHQTKQFKAHEVKDYSVSNLGGLCVYMFISIYLKIVFFLLAGLHRGTRNNAYQKGRICSEDLFCRLRRQVSSMTRMGVVTFSNFWIFIFQFSDIYISIFDT